MHNVRGHTRAVIAPIAVHTNALDTSTTPECIYEDLILKSEDLQDKTYAREIVSSQYTKRCIILTSSWQKKGPRVLAKAHSKVLLVRSGVDTVYSSY